MRTNRTLFLFFLLCLFFVYTSAQTPQKKTSAEDYGKVIAKNNALNLANEVGEKASGLSDVNQKIEIQLQTSKVLWRFEPDKALKFLESAWRNAASETEKKLTAITSYQRAEILNFALKVAPESAKKWSQESSKETSDKEAKPDETSDSSPQRQKAYLIVQTALAKLDDSPEQAVSAAISSIYQTGKISYGFNELIERLVNKKRLDLIEKIYQNITAFVADKASSDPQDLLVSMNLMLKNSAGLENQNKLLIFLLNSGRQIIINQSSPNSFLKLSPEEIFSVYQNFALGLKPFVQHNMVENLSTLEGLLRDLSNFVPAEKLADPLLSPDSIEIQIENPEKTDGSKERDIRFSKIITWLLNGSNGQSRIERNGLKLAKKIVDEITDLDARQKFSDFIKVGKIEKLVADKNLTEAQNLALKISSPEIKSWALLALGKIQDGIPSVSVELYDDSFRYLAKANSSNYKTQLALILASLQVKNDKNKALEYLTEAAKYSNQIDDEKKQPSGLQIIFFSDIGDFNFASADMEIKSEEIFIPEELNQLAITNWYQTLSISQQIQPLSVRFSFQLEMAKFVLQKLSTDEPKTKLATQINELD